MQRCFVTEQYSNFPPLRKFGYALLTSTFSVQSSGLGFSGDMPAVLQMFLSPVKLGNKNHISKSGKTPEKKSHFYIRLNIRIKILFLYLVKHRNKNHIFKIKFMPENQILRNKYNVLYINMHGWTFHILPNLMPELCGIFRAIF